MLREIDDGLVEETRGLLARGYDESLGSMKALGYRQMTGYLKGRYGWEEAVRRLQRDTRHFAKRQLTWFRSDPALTWLTITEQDSAGPVAQRILDHLSRAGIVPMGTPLRQDLAATDAAGAGTQRAGQVA